MCSFALAKHVAILCALYFRPMLLLSEFFTPSLRRLDKR
jgi:hypothetical protein